MQNNYKGIINTDRKLLLTVSKSLIVGILAGLAVVAYRWLLGQAEHVSFQIYDAVRGSLPQTALLFCALIGCGAFIGLLVRRFPLISGSGIPQVKGIMLGYLDNRWLPTLIAKFFGGALCIVSGLSLGREGPSIQLGACVADGFASKYGATRMEKKILMASGASAGLAAAFNAPLAGVIFTLEEIFKYFSPTILLSAMTAAVSADFVAKCVFGLAPVFHFPVEDVLPLRCYWLLPLLGILLGAAGAVYNTGLLFGQRAYGKAAFIPEWLRPVVPFVCAGILGLVYPVVLGGGHELLSLLTPETGLFVLFAALLIKFLFSVISFGSGAPGGIFFPLLVMGASLGAIFGHAAVGSLALESSLFYNFIILAMAGFFASIVRAPITGIILIIEMTGSLSHLLSLTVVSLISCLTADLLKSRPIYDSLLARLVKKNHRSVSAGKLRGKRRTTENNAADNAAEAGGTADEDAAGAKTTVEVIVHLNSPAAGKAIRDLPWPPQCLLIALKRDGKEIIPKGDTVIRPEDYLICLIPLSAETEIRKNLRHLVEKD